MAATNYTKCNLFLPHKDYLFRIPELELGSDGKLTQESVSKFNQRMKQAAEAAQDNYNAIERWGNLIGPMICNCNCGGVG